jgi:hypothetical protein
VRLNLLSEVLRVPFIGVPVVHESLFHELQVHGGWRDVRSTRCSSHPKAGLKIGERYFCTSLPPDLQLDLLYPGGEKWQCEACGRWVFSSGRILDPYVVAPRALFDRVHAFMSSTSNDLLVTAPLREHIAGLGIGTIGWETITVFSERLPEHQVKEGMAPAKTLAVEPNVEKDEVLVIVPESHLTQDDIMNIEDKLIAALENGGGGDWRDHKFEEQQHCWMLLFGGADANRMAKDLLPVLTLENVPAGSYILVGNKKKRFSIL